MIAILAAASVAWFPPTGSSWSAAQAELAHIPSASGGSVLQQAKACHVRFRKSESWIQKSENGVGPPGAAPGDTVLEIYFDPPFFATLIQPDAVSDQVARWIIHDGHPKPDSDWAVNLQQKKPPYGPAAWMRCR